MNTQKLMINYDCKFRLGEEANAWQAWYDDSAWENVQLPHDWSVHLPFSKDYSSGTGYLAGGIGWYRIHIEPRKEWEGKNISITFDGVYKNSRVWVNSYYLGERPNGYISFTYDLTEFFKFDDDNIVSVYVDRREIADSRWFTGSGIIGKVYLTVEEAVHPKHDSVFFTTPVADKEKATWKTVSTWINNSNEDAKLIIHHKLFDKKNNMVDEVTDNLTVKENCEESLTVTSTMGNPSLWSPNTPELYTLQISAEKDGAESIMYSEKVGIRSFNFDPDKGFTLNGVPTLFKGVCLHHDAGVLGGAVPPAVWYDRLEKLKEMGCNAIRMSHNPHVPELYYLCDSMGFLVMDEAFDEWEGPKNKWSTGHNVYPPKHEGYYVNFHTWGERDLVDMILRNRNHPSIVMWSTGNEIDYPNDPYCHASFRTSTGNNDANKPEAERQYNSRKPDAKRLKVLAAKLTKLVKSVDTTRPVTLAASFPELSVKVGFIDSLDVVGFNYREYLYEEHHKAYPEKSFLGSENGQGLKEWRAVTDNDYISGQFLWTGIDYLGEAHGWPIHGSYAGLLTIAGLKKPGYYRRQSFWSEQNVVSIVTVPYEKANYTAWGAKMASAIECEFSAVERHWNYTEGEKVVVKCYTNAHSVEVFVNGESIGRQEKCRDFDCVIFETDYKSGEIKAVAYDDAGKKVAEDELKTYHEVFEYKINCIKISNDELPLLKQLDDKASDAFNNLYRYEVMACDALGNRVYSADNMLSVSVTGGKLIGLENGDLADVTDYSQFSRRTYKGELVAYVVADNGIIPELTIKG